MGVNTRVSFSYATVPIIHNLYSSQFFSKVLQAHGEGPSRAYLL